MKTGDNMERVFIPQIATRLDRDTGRVSPVLDFSAAAMHGQLIEVLESNDNPLFIHGLMPKIRKVLESFTEHDCLLAVGDPSLIAACAAVISRRSPIIHLLKWDRNMRAYIKIRINI